MPSHRALALFRGRNEGCCRLRSSCRKSCRRCRQQSLRGHIAAHFGLRDQGRPGDKWLLDTVRWAWKVKLSLHLELDLMNALVRARRNGSDPGVRQQSERPVAGGAGRPKAVIGLDPGIRTGVKVAVVDRTGKVLDTA
jgi:protein Tex